MRRLNQLIDKVSEISLGGGGRGDLFPYLREFFSRDEVKKKLIEFNQYQLYNLEQDRNGRAIGTYAPRTVTRKIKHGLPSSNYTFYESGDFFRSMDVVATDVDVIVTTTMDASSGLGLDSIGKINYGGQQHPNHIAWMMSRYNPSGSSLGIQDNYMRTIIDETDMVKELRDNILDHLDNG